MNTNNYFIKIEDTIRKNLDSRGLNNIRVDGDLKKGIMELFNSTTVVIVTGFVIRDTMTGETDGPIGAISLARSLEILGKNVILITDKYSHKILEAGADISGLKAPIKIMPFNNQYEFSQEILKLYKPTHLVAIERPGRAEDGNCYSMRGENLSDLVPNTDILFRLAKDMKITTIAVGDGGNEVGMGKVASSIKEYVPKGDKICASFTSDILIIAGVSNWGGHALSAGLSILSKDMLLHNTNVEIEILDSMVKSGAVDGCTKKQSLTVDGLDLEDNIKVLDRLRDIVTDKLLQS